MNLSSLFSKRKPQGGLIKPCSYAEVLNHSGPVKSEHSHEKVIYRHDKRETKINSMKEFQSDLLTLEESINNLLQAFKEKHTGVTLEVFHSSIPVGTKAGQMDIDNITVRATIKRTKPVL